MAIHRKAGLQLLLIVAAAIGSSVSLLGAAGPAIASSVAASAAEQASA